MTDKEIDKKFRKLMFYRALLVISIFLVGFFCRFIYVSICRLYSKFIAVISIIILCLLLLPIYFIVTGKLIEFGDEQNKLRHEKAVNQERREMGYDEGSDIR